jgi:hypothetical protein
MHYLPRGDKSSPSGRWSICAPALPEVLTFRNLKLDDPRISDSYHKLLHKQFECHNIYERVKRSLKDAWQMVGLLKMNMPTKP